MGSPRRPGLNTPAEPNTPAEAPRLATRRPRGASATAGPTAGTDAPRRPAEALPALLEGRQAILLKAPVRLFKRLIEFLDRLDLFPLLVGEVALHRPPLLEGRRRNRNPLLALVLL
jgi:hypothetical protein